MRLVGLEVIPELVELAFPDLVQVILIACPHQLVLNNRILHFLCCAIAASQKRELHSNQVRILLVDIVLDLAIPAYNNPAMREGANNLLCGKAENTKFLHALDCKEHRSWFQSEHCIERLPSKDFDGFLELLIEELLVILSIGNARFALAVD